MKIKSRTIINSLITGIIIFSLIFSAYYLNNKHTIFAGLFSANDHKSASSIINSRYNSYLEGTVLDNIYAVNAKLIINKEVKTLHKNISLSPNIYISEDYANVDVFNSNDLSKNNNPKSSSHNKTIFNKPYNNFNSFLNIDNISDQNKNNLNYSLNTQELFPRSKSTNRFERMVEEFKKVDTKNSKSNKGKVYNNEFISGVKNWESPKTKLYTSLNSALKYNERNKFNKFLNRPNIFDDSGIDTSINNNIVRYSKRKSRINFDIVRDFSSDPLKSVIQNVLIPGGLPKTPANVDAVAKGMGLPSGALGSSSALAGSLGLTVDELSDPNTKLPSETVISINRNKSYIGQELNINNTTLADYYNQALKSNFFSGLNIK